MHARLVLLVVVAALAASAPAVAEQKPLGKPAPAKSLWEDHFAVKDGKGGAKGGVTHEDTREQNRTKGTKGAVQK